MVSLIKGRHDVSQCEELLEENMVSLIKGRHDVSQCEELLEENMVSLIKGRHDVSQCEELLEENMVSLIKGRHDVSQCEECRCPSGKASSSRAAVAWLVGCLTSQQHASVSQGRICSDNSTCCHTETEVADPTFHLNQSQYTDTLPTRPSTYPITLGA